MSIMIAHVAGNHSAERRAYAGGRTNDALREIETTGAESDVGDNEGNHDAKDRSRDAVQHLHGDQQRRIVDVANNTPRSASAAKAIMSSGRRPQTRALRPTDGDISATIACGTMMQSAISTGAHSLERAVTIPAINGNMAALANWSRKTAQAKTIKRPLMQKMEDAGRIGIRLRCAQSHHGPVPDRFPGRGFAPTKAMSRLTNAKLTTNTARLDSKYPTSTHHRCRNAIAKRCIARVAS